MKNILEYLEKTASERPERPALCDEGGSMTFGGLLRAARAGGSALAERGLTGGPVAVFMRKSPQMAAAFFAAVYAGAFYVPLEESMPAHRIKLILGHVSPGTVICDEATAGYAAEYGFADRAVMYSELVSHAEDAGLLAGIRRRQIDTDPIYVVFTSGSTGMPKGVVGCHRSVIDYAESFTRVIGADGTSVFGMQVPLYVDACLKELLSVIKCGSEAWLMPQSLFTSPVRTVEYLNAYGINTLCWVASALTLVSGLGAFDEVRPKYLRTVCFGSEVFPAKQLRLWREACPGARFINLYGPTEATGMSFWYEVRRDFADGEPIPVGRPFENTGFMLLRDDGTEAENGETGEICLRGTPLTLGYYGDPERTAASFCQNPLNTLWPERIYRTGDLGYLDADGELVFVSRRDLQIKHMGHRIELGEIESVACSMDGVESACCLWDAEKKRIILFYMGPADEKQTHRALRAGLPRYMAPAETRRLDALPLLPNGKLDRSAMRAEYEDKTER